MQQAGVASKEYEFGRWEWREPTLNERRADSAVPATASSGRATVLTKPELQVTASGHELGVVNSAVYAGGRRVADVAIEEAGDGRNDPVMSSGSVWSSPVTIFCNGRDGSLICIHWPLRMPPMPTGILS
jgi:hypothetical protein